MSTTHIVRYTRLALVFLGILAAAIVVAGQGSNPPKAAIAIDAHTVIREIPRTLFGANVEWRWNGNLLWDEASQKPATRIVELAKELGVSVVRYPGGGLSDYYHWKDGTGPAARRKEVRHLAGEKDASRPLFGTDEVLAFAKEIGAEPLFTANAGTGTAAEAGEWVRYTNGRVGLWEVGNELYINDGTPMAKATSIPPDKYAARYLEFARAMRAANPRIKLMAIGGENQGRYALVSYPNWNRTVLERAGREIDYLAVHNAYSPGMFLKHKLDVRTIYRSMMGASVLIARNLRTLEEQIARYAPAESRDRIRLAVTEWGPLFNFNPADSLVDHNKTLGSALFAASAFQAFLNSPRTEIANFFLLNDVSVLGWIADRSGKFPPAPEWTPTARYLALQLYSRHFGSKLVGIKTQSPEFRSEAAGITDAVANVPFIDAVASVDTTGNRLYLIAVNRNLDDAVDADVRIDGFAPAAQANTWTLNGRGIDSHTGTRPMPVPGVPWGRQLEDPVGRRMSAGGPGEITVEQKAIANAKGMFTYRFPAHSITAFEFVRTGGRRGPGVPKGKR